MGKDHRKKHAKIFSFAHVLAAVVLESLLAGQYSTLTASYFDCDLFPKLPHWVHY